LLIISSFFLLTNEGKRDNIFWLNIIVASVIYLINVSNFFDFFSFNKSFESSIAGIGVRWFWVTIYSVIAILGIIFGLTMPIGFNIQLFYQSVILFGLIVSLYVSYIAASHSNSVTNEESLVRADIKQIAELLLRIEFSINSKGAEWEVERQLVLKLKDKSRYLSASNNNLAKELEKEFIQVAQLILSDLNKTSIDRQLIVKNLNHCDTLLKQRKELYFN
jgi:hypothetical protein